MVWVHLHNLPADYWDGDTLEALTEPIGKLHKIDDYTSNLSQTGFARVFLELDLACPLRRGFWLEDGNVRVFVVLLQKKLRSFCYHCEMVEHGTSACSRIQGYVPNWSGAAASTGIDSDEGHKDWAIIEVSKQWPTQNMDARCSAPQPSEEVIKKLEFGQWMISEQQ